MNSLAVSPTISADFHSGPRSSPHVKAAVSPTISADFHSKVAPSGRSGSKLFHPPFRQISTAVRHLTLEQIRAVSPTISADFHSLCYRRPDTVVAVSPTISADFHSPKTRRRSLSESCFTHHFGRFPQLIENCIASTDKLFHPPFRQISTAAGAGTTTMSVAVSPTISADFHSPRLAVIMWL